jgi:addiction module HigA family antidote
MKKVFNSTREIAIHPGEILLEMLDENNISQAQLARHLKMDPSKINEICKGRRGISADMAVMLAKALRVSASTWMNLQKN